MATVLNYQVTWWFIPEKPTNIDMRSKIPKVGVESRLDIDYADKVLKPAFLILL